MVENPTSEVSVPQEDNRYFSSINVVKLAFNRGNIYEYPHKGVSVSRY